MKEVAKKPTGPWSRRHISSKHMPYVGGAETPDAIQQEASTIGLYRLCSWSNQFWTLGLYRAG